MVFGIDEKANESSDSDNGGVNVEGVNVTMGYAYVVVVVDFVGRKVIVALNFSKGVVLKVDESGMKVVVTVAEFCGGGLGIDEVIILVSEPEASRFRGFLFIF